MASLCRIVTSPQRSIPFSRSAVDLLEAVDVGRDQLVLRLLLRPEAVADRLGVRVLLARNPPTGSDLAENPRKMSTL